MGFLDFLMPKGPSISAAELKEQMKKNRPVLLDVREPFEYAQKNIPGSLQIPIGQLGQRLNELEKYKEKEIVVYCRSGSRSGFACTMLRKHGFNAINLSGGMMGW
ncbi:MAG: rhodanese-like domain-containing protein [Chlorobiales bacterium]|nr:rhodanese-like domain-containing protein [Chlorobiales bacterium]